MEKVESKKVNRRKTAVVAVIVAVILILGVSSLVLLSKSTKKSEPSIITTSTLEKILNVSDLSTFEAIYNGVAKVVSPDDPQRSIIMCRMTLQLKPVLILIKSKFLLMMRRKSFQ